MPTPDQIRIMDDRARPRITPAKLLGLEVFVEAVFFFAMLFIAFVEVG